MHIDDDGVITDIKPPKEQIEIPFVRSPYNYNMDTASLLSGLACLDGTRTQQQFKDECDINTIVRKFGLTGELPENIRMPQSGDFTDAPNDYQAALNLVLAAEQEFLRVPSDIRARFENDPGKFSDFCLDAKNKDELERLGLAKKKTPAPGPLAVRVVADPDPPKGPPAPPPPPPQKGGKDQ